jgi:hypothetical protein
MTWSAVETDSRSRLLDELLEARRRSSMWSAKAASHREREDQRIIQRG